MKETSPLWRQIAPSEFPWEREALDFVRQGLPDHEPYRAWANFEFLAEDGKIHEVDLLVLSPKGLFLVEIKSWSGTLEGDASTWVIHQDGRVQTHDNPLLLANRKARKLASLLKRQKAGRSVRIPFIEPLVFLSSPALQLKLTGAARQGVHLRDREAQGTVPARPGILAALSRFDPAELLQAGKVRLDRPVASPNVRLAPVWNAGRTFAWPLSGEMLSLLEAEFPLNVPARHFARHHVQKALYIRRELLFHAFDLLGILRGDLRGPLRRGFRGLGPPQRLDELAALLPEPWRRESGLAAQRDHVEDSTPRLLHVPGEEHRLRQERVAWDGGVGAREQREVRLMFTSPRGRFRKRALLARPPGWDR